MFLLFASSSNKTIISLVKNETKNIWSVFFISWCYKRDFSISSMQCTCDWLTYYLFSLESIHELYNTAVLCLLGFPFQLDFHEPSSELDFCFGLGFTGEAVQLQLSMSPTWLLLLVLFHNKSKIQRTCTFLYFQSSNVILFTFLYCKLQVVYFVVALWSSLYSRSERSWIVGKKCCG